MTGIYPTTADNAWYLSLKAAQNLYNYALMKGVTGLNPPSVNDPFPILYRKSAYYTAALVDLQ